MTSLSPQSTPGCAAAAFADPLIAKGLTNHLGPDREVQQPHRPPILAPLSPVIQLLRFDSTVPQLGRFGFKIRCGQDLWILGG